MASSVSHSSQAAAASETPCLARFAASLSASNSIYMYLLYAQYSVSGNGLCKPLWAILQGRDEAKKATWMSRSLEDEDRGGGVYPGVSVQIITTADSVPSVAIAVSLHAASSDSGSEVVEHGRDSHPPPGMQKRSRAP